MVRKYYQWLLCVVTLVFVTSCNQSRNGSVQVIVSTYDDSVVIEKTPRGNKVLPDELGYGKIIPPEFNDSMKSEKNMLSQVASYNSALLHGDVNTCYRFLYPDAFQYCRKFYPEFPDEEVIKIFFKETSGDMQESLKGWKKMGVDFEIVVSKLHRKVVYGDDIIIVFDVTSNMCSDDVFIHSKFTDKTIGISQNKGKNWWFMTDHEDLPAILRMHYNQDVIDAVMGY